MPGPDERRFPVYENPKQTDCIDIFPAGEATMKFHCLHLLRYAYLPDNCKEKHSSVWVDVPAGEVYDPVKRHQVYDDYLDQLEFAERAGFDGSCVNEHHQNGYGLMPSPNLMAA